MKPEPEKTSRGPPEPYVIDGQPYLNVRQAAQIIGSINDETLRKWAKHGSTPFGFELDIRRISVTHHRRSTQTPRTFRQQRLLIPVEKVEALREILLDQPMRPGPFSREDMEWLEAAARRYRFRLSHSSRSHTP